MATIPQKRDSTSPVILLAIVILGAILGYFYYNSALKDQAFVIPTFEIPPNDTLSGFKDFKLDFSPFDNLKFRALRVFGESPVQPGSTGKSDLFAPF